LNSDVHIGNRVDQTQVSGLLLALLLVHFLCNLLSQVTKTGQDMKAAAM
jgi:hypothetical protein